MNIKKKGKGRKGNGDEMRLKGSRKKMEKKKPKINALEIRLIFFKAKSFFM
jgi:hypothetical protein